MKFLYLEAVGGASGDMLLGAFLDDLVPFEHLKNEIARLSLKNYKLELSETQKQHISAKKFTVQSHEHAHRHLSDIENLINTSSLSVWVKENAIAVFRALGKQEAKIHQMPLEKIHFHEVGAVDSIIDIVGTFICLDFLKPERVFTSPLPVSRGFVKAAHGNLPVPAPATLALLKNYPVIYHSMEGELVTPTGAALVTYLSEGNLPSGQPFRISSIGYGAGSKDWEELPNLLRIWKGEFSGTVAFDTVFQIETNIDDMNPEIYPHIQEKLLDAGAMDVTLYQGIMKKGRPGTLISVLAGASDLNHIRNILYRETSTIGFRYFPVNREKLKREVVKIDSPWGKIQVKKVNWENQEKLLPEYEECKRIGLETGEPLQTIFKKVESFLQQHQKLPANES